MDDARNGGLKVGYEQEMLGRRRDGTLRRCSGDAVASRRRTYGDGELDVFAAERYFKGAMDGERDEGSSAAAERTAVRSVVVAVGRPAGTSCASAASAGSGASANSQTVLLREARRRSRRPGYGGERCCLGVGGLLRSCSRSQAVRVDGGGGGLTEAKGSGKPPDSAGSGNPPAASRIEWYRDLRMEKAGLGQARHGLPPNLNLGAAAIGREEKATFRRRSFTLQAPVRVAGSGGSGGGDDENGGGSDSSSDLFEIKSLMIDDCPYEPSEASIQWSVVTASAADVSVLSESGGRRGRVAARQQVGRDRQVGRLTGCVSRRAVAVGRLPGAPAPLTAPYMLNAQPRRDRAAIDRH